MQCLYFFSGNRILIMLTFYKRNILNAHHFKANNTIYLIATIVSFNNLIMFKFKFFQTMRLLLKDLQRVLLKFSRSHIIIMVSCRNKHHCYLHIVFR